MESAPAEAVDRSFEVAEVRRDGRVLRVRPPLRLEPRHDAEGDAWYAEDAALNVHVYARSRGELLREAEDYLCFLWDANAEADPAALAEDAVRLRAALRSRVTAEGADAA